MGNRKNLCAMIPESLHQQVREEQEKLALTLSQYVEQVLQEHFIRGGKVMSEKMRTLAFQVSEELFARIKAHLAKTGMSQKDFVIGLIEQALAVAEMEQTLATDNAQGDETMDEPTEAISEQAVDLIREQSEEQGNELIGERSEEQGNELIGDLIAE